MPAPLGGLFLFHPEIVLKLMGFSLRKMFGEALYKRVSRLLADENIEDVGPIRFEAIAEEISGGAGLPDTFLAALQGDEEARRKLDDIGLWGAFLWGMNSSRRHDLPYHLDYVVSLERACQEPTKLVLERDFGGAARAIANHPLLAPVVDQRAGEILVKMTDRDGLLPWRASVAVEAHLSILAAWEAQSGSSESKLVALLPTSELNPIGVWFRWIKKEAGAKSITSFLDRVGVAEATAKNWSSGKQLPTMTVHKLLMESIFGDKQNALGWFNYWAAKQLLWLGYLAKKVERGAKCAKDPDARAVLPWPAYPFGHASFEAWCQARYPFWFDYHARRKRAKGKAEVLPA